MTTNEAKQKINACETQIVNAHKELKNKAKLVGANAAQTASNKTLLGTVLPLVLCIIGLFCFSGPWFLGILLIILGIFIAYSIHSSAKIAQNKIEKGQEALNNTIDYNANI